MNRKIFTLLASALMLLTTAFTGNAKITFGNLAVGDVVNTLQSGDQLGVYHIRVDSVYVGKRLDTLTAGPAGSGSTYPTGTPVYGSSDWTSYGIYGTYYNQWTGFVAVTGNANLIAYMLDATPSAGSLGSDTLVIALREDGRPVLVSMNDFKRWNSAVADGINYRDLQATMWCINVERTAETGYRPTFKFRNKIFGLPFDLIPGKNYVDERDNIGWMYSDSYTSGQLKYGQPFYQYTKDGKENVVVLERKSPDLTGLPNLPFLKFKQGGTGTALPTGTGHTGGATYVIAESATNAARLAEEVEGMLKLSIVEVAPVVLDAEGFNYALGSQTTKGNIKLKFYPEPTVLTNYFAEPLTAEDTEWEGYLYVKNSSNNYIFNAVKTPKYTNFNGNLYTEIQSGPFSNIDPTVSSNKFSGGTYMNNNGAYRFVYFPTKDSLVINALVAGHSGNLLYPNPIYVDSVPYNNPDGIKQPPLWSASYRTDDPYLYWGLYNTTIHDALLVVNQDLNNNQLLLTIEKKPANVRITMGNLNCNELPYDAWTPDPGVYTIWDERGYVLGIRIFNGSLAPQWFPPVAGELPDRIPAYQWVVEYADNEHSRRVNITNREFGDLTSAVVKMENVLIQKTSTQIFMNQTQFFNYPGFQSNGTTGAAEPINYGYVTGQYLQEFGPTVHSTGPLATGGIKSGFRPVTRKYVSDQFLGYKHFTVGQKVGEPNFGKSEDIGATKGMDYNAFAFNYLHAFTDEDYISVGTRYDEYVLQVGGMKEGFQFRLGTDFRSPTTGYAEEDYGYPEKATEYKLTNYPYEAGFVQKAADLIRYYYELKVADYYNYRTELAEIYVVLKGFAASGTDARNRLHYGLANLAAGEDDMEFANVYLRESYFLEKPKSNVDEERNEYDPSTRVYYAIIERLRQQQLDVLETIAGFEITEVLEQIPDASTTNTTKYSTLAWAVDPDSYIYGKGKTLSSTTISAFALENYQAPLYRRLNSVATDNAAPDGTATGYDAPKVFKFYLQRAKSYYLYEAGNSYYSDGKGNEQFLEVSNADQNLEGVVAPDGTIKYNYKIFVDTAYINRGTGPIKPQYLLAVGLKKEVGDVVNILTETKTVRGVEDPRYCGTGDYTLLPYYRGRYLVNATDSSRQLNSDGSDGAPVRDEDYLVNTSWDRFVFVDAIHTDDRLYIVSELERHGIPESAYTVKSDADGKVYLWADGLRAAVAAITPFKDANGDWHKAERLYDDPIRYGVYYDFGRWNNYHNDVCFSFRFVNVTARNASYSGGVYEEGTDNDSKAFLIESETFAREPYGNPKIAPMKGGWARLNNIDPVVLSRDSYEKAINQGTVFNVESTDASPEDATQNEAISPIKVVAGSGEVSILNAAGKKVTLTNILGQTITDVVLNSDNVTVKAPKGIVIVSVEGENTVKSIVK